MRIPESWLREYVTLADNTTATQIADALTKAGLEVESIEYAGSDVTGPVVIGKILEFVGEPQKNGKVINWCQVDCGEHNEIDAEGKNTGRRGIICGAHNFAVGDYVVAALPGAVLPGDFAIASRKTYGHISDGMLCAVDELNMGTDHTGIIVLPEVVDGHQLIPGEDAAPILHLRDTVYVVELTPDMGYCQSVRGVAREVAQALGARFVDPLIAPMPELATDGFPVKLQTDRCRHFVALTLDGVNASAETPRFMRRRLHLAGMRSISLAVDVTNYVMLLTGQPLHAYDATKLTDGIIVRMATEGEKLTTLDGAERKLSADDMVIADGSGVIGLAGVMGGASTEIAADTTRIVLEAAHFEPASVARAARRHGLTSEASKRFERTVDPAAPWPAAQLVAQLLTKYAGGQVQKEYTLAGGLPEPVNVSMSADLPSRVLGRELDREKVISTLAGSGVAVTAMGNSLTLTAPTWRPDLTGPQEYVEEVARKTGIDDIPAVLPAHTHRGGLSAAQRRRRLVAETLAASGLVEVATMPFVDDLAEFGIDDQDPRRAAVRLANPLTAHKPYFRSTLLPGLVEAAQRNTARSAEDLALFEIGQIAFHSVASTKASAPLYPTGERPTAEQLAELDAALPVQERHLAALWTGKCGADGWQLAFASAEAVASVYGATVTRAAAEYMPFHPGRCARLDVAGRCVGYAGELHPHVIEAVGLAPRTAALEINLDLVEDQSSGPAKIGALSTYPVTKEDLALIVDRDVAASDVAAALREGAGPLLEDVALFDVYTCDALGPDKKSLAFALRFRGADRTLKQEEVTAAREAGIAKAAERLAAELRQV